MKDDLLAPASIVQPPRKAEETSQSCQQNPVAIWADDKLQRSTLGVHLQTLAYGLNLSRFLDLFQRVLGIHPEFFVILYCLLQVRNCTLGGRANFAERLNSS